MRRLPAPRCTLPLSCAVTLLLSCLLPGGPFPHVSPGNFPRCSPNAASPRKPFFLLVRRTLTSEGPLVLTSLVSLRCFCLLPLSHTHSFSTQQLAAGFVSSTSLSSLALTVRGWA